MTVIKSVTPTTIDKWQHCNCGVLLGPSKEAFSITIEAETIYGKTLLTNIKCKACAEKDQKELRNYIIDDAFWS